MSSGAISSRSVVAFWIAMVVGAALRIYCVGFTVGTGDMEDWEDHATQVRNRGLIGYYHANEFANHPPFISEAESLTLRVAELTGIPFRILFRAQFAGLDAASTLLLILLLSPNRARYWMATCYWLSPASIILSSYHGNTDSAIAFLLLLSAWSLTNERIFAGAVVFGISLWIKLPGILVAPAFILFLPNWRSRFLFLAVAAITAASTYLPGMIQDPHAVLTNVFGYHGLILQTTGGIPFWGPSVLLFSTFAPANAWPEWLLRPAVGVLSYSWQIGIAVMFVLIWLRRSCRRTPMEFCATIGMAYVVLYAFSDYWAFQYFAWSLPFWFFLPRWFWFGAVALISAYLYALHWLFCGNPALLGEWNFGAHPQLPFVVVALRNISVTFFFVSACVFLYFAARTSGLPNHHKEMETTAP